MTDKQLELRSSVTASTGTSAVLGTAVEIPQGLRGEILWIRVDFWEAAVGSSTGTLIFKSTHSYDGSTYGTCFDGALDVIALATAAKRGVLFIPISGKATYFNVSAIATGTSPTWKWNARVVQKPI